MVRTAAAGSVSSAAGPATFFSRSSSRARIRRWTASDDATGPARPAGSDGSATASAAGGEVRDGGDEALAPGHGAASACPLPAPFPPSAARTEDSDPRPPAAATRFHRGWWNSWRAPPLRTCKRHVSNAGRRAHPYPRDADPRDGQSAGRITPIAEDRSKQLRRRRKQADVQLVLRRGPAIEDIARAVPREFGDKSGGVLFRPHRVSGAGQSLHPGTQPGGDPAIRERETVEWRASKTLVGSRRQVRSSVPPRRLQQFRRREPLVSKP